VGQEKHLAVATVLCFAKTDSRSAVEEIKNITKDGELSESSTIKKFFTVQKEGKREIRREEIASVNIYDLMK
jgi:hypothetical protein